MTDTELEAWLTERKRILAAATEGPWETSQAADEESTTWIEAGNVDVLVHDTRGQGHMREEFAWMKRVDAVSIVDAHNHLPALIAMVEAVLGVLNENTPPDPCQPDDPAGMCPDCYLTGEIHRALEAARKAVSGDAE